MNKNNHLKNDLRITTTKTFLAVAVRTTLGLGGVTAVMSIASTALAQGAFDPEVDLFALDGSDGFVIRGISAGDKAGESVSGLGDINGDGVDDFIMGAGYASPTVFDAGESYVVFGGASVGNNGTIEASGLDGSDGFVINGIDFAGRAGRSVSSAGDFNGDGVNDLVIGARSANANGNASAGESYIVFGGGNLGSSGSIELSSLDGNDGFVINGIDVGDASGRSVSGIDDFNGDGIDDVIIGANAADPNGDSFAGESYVLFGGNSMGSSGSFNLSGLDGSDGFVVNGINMNDESGMVVSGAGDINGDGMNDLLIGAGAADPNGKSRAGETYVLFGGSSVGSNGIIQLFDLDGSNGFVMNGVDSNDNSGSSISGAGDVNGDGVDDLIVGASFADQNLTGGGQKLNSGESYVLFGNANLGSSGTVEFSNLDGSDGFVIFGIAQGDRSGFSVSDAGDVNGDGVDDLIIGATSASTVNGVTGQSYVVFGNGNLGSTGTFELEDIDGFNGFKINGDDSGDGSGSAVSGAGDINGDGIDDVLIGAPNADKANAFSVGESYVVFGKAVTTLTCNGLLVTVNLNLGQTPGPGNDVVLGTSGADDIRGRAGNDTICGMGGADFIHGNSGDDWIDGGNGVDNIRGGQGSDMLFSGLGATVGTNSRVFGGTGDDTIFGDSDRDDLRGGKGDDIIYGEGGADSITGNEDDDSLFGGPGADVISGGNGRNDELFGEAGNDSLNGGSGVNDFCDGGGQNGDTNTNCEVF